MPREHHPEGLTLVTGNRLEDLADALAAVLDRPPADPLAPETVIVQSRGMERWVSLALADRLGICANLHFPFPNAFLDTVMTAVFADLNPVALMDRDTLTFRMMAPLTDPGLAAPELSAYLGEGEDTGLKTYQLARHLSDRFDQYAVFRPEMVAGWLAGAGGHWQARLWRRVFADVAADHRASRLSRLVSVLAGGRLRPPGLPQRVSLFGISYLPPLYTAVFRALAAITQVTVFLLNPCREYWAHIRPRRRIQRAVADTGAAAGVAEPIEAWLHLETGNRLLASWGRLGQEYFERLCGMDELVTREVFTAPGEDTLLTRLQTDILELRESEADAGFGGPGDESVQVHACHSPMREVEVLNDLILHLLDTRPGLTPADILVMTPDIDTYAPLVEAVFGTRAANDARIPFHTADRGGAAARPVVQAFLFLLSLNHRRLTVSEVSAFMAYPFVRAAFLISDADMAAMDQWIEKTVIRWGMDSRHRARLGLPPVAANTWREGIRRLLMGYAAGDGPDPDTNCLWDDILAYTPVEGSDALRFGQVVDFLETLFDAVTAMDTPRSLAGWAAFLQPLVERFFAAEAVDPGDLKALTRQIHRMAELEPAAGFWQPVDVTVAAAWLADVCADQHGGGGFLSGGITVCAMLPMRSIPARVICLLGMNNDGYPRRDRQSAIDLMAADPRPGDRSTRNDDRYLFLESVISAREILCITYVGQSVTDNTPLPPSVLVSELVDYLTTRGGVSEADLVRRHRLQPFSEAYFTGEGPLFSYGAENCLPPASAEAPAPFFGGPLPEPPPAALGAQVADVCRFFQHPPRYLANRRLGIVIPVPGEGPKDREPFALDGRERWTMGTELIEALVRGRSAADCRRAHLASGFLAPGAPGEAASDRLWRDVKALYRRIRPWISRPPEAVTVAVTACGLEISGPIEGVTPEGRIEYRFGKLRPVDRVSGWIRHLVWQAAAGEGCGGGSRLMAEDASIRYAAVADPQALLRSLVIFYRDGLREPLPFLPDPSYTYAARWKTGQWSGPAPLIAEMAARDRDARGTGSVAADPYVALCWRHRDFFDAAFARVALAVCEPMIAHETR